MSTFQRVTPTVSESLLAQAIGDRADTSSSQFVSNHFILSLHSLYASPSIGSRRLFTHLFIIFLTLRLSFIPISLNSSICSGLAALVVRRNRSGTEQRKQPKRRLGALATRRPPPQTDAQFHTLAYWLYSFCNRFVLIAFPLNSRSRVLRKPLARLC